jgi:hypothetical protein
MVNPFHEVNWRPNLAQRRQFAKSWMLGFPCLAVVIWLLGWLARGRWDAHLATALGVAGIGAAAGLILYLLPQIAQPFYLVWYGLACCIGLIVSNLMLAGMFYLVITPIGLLRRLAHSSFRKSFDRQCPTYWQDAGPPPPPHRYFKQF